MKRSRRVEIRIERHELSIYASASQGSPGKLSGNPSGNQSCNPARPPIVSAKPDQSGLRTIAPQACPICGCRQLLLLTEAIASTGNKILQAGLESGIYHLHCSPIGEWWVCGQSSLPG